MKNLNEKTYNTVLNETYDEFQARGISIVGEGYREIATSAALFEHYVDSLTEGANADNAVVMSQLMTNSNASILRESSLTGIQPISSLTMPVIRKLWPKFALKDAIDKEVAKSPRFSVSYTKPYMYKGDNVEDKVYLPRGLRGAEYGYGDESQMDELVKGKGLGKEYTAVKDVTLTAGAATVVDWKDDPHVNIANTPSNAKLQPLDELVIVSAEFGGTDAFAKEGTIKIGKRLGVYGNGIYDFAGGQLIVQFDGKNHKATFAAIGKAVKLEVKAAVSSEYNEESWSVGFDILRQDIDIPSGQHINAPLPVEALNDMMALYQIDGTKETVELMTNVFAQKLDLEILDFLRDSLANRPSNEAYQDGYGTTDEFVLSFDCKPAAGFAGSPKAWREELKPLIDYLAQKIKNETFFGAGKFTIVGNPLDVQILANVDWQFRGGNGGNMDGVDVDYSVGTYVGANSYKVIASVNVPQGAMYLVFTPSANTQLTYKYYPYAFLTELGYTDPNRSRVPSIMMTQRHTMFEFMPAIGAIVIANNDGKSYFREATEWKQVQ